jgi:hypothetical protein
MQESEVSEECVTKQGIALLCRSVIAFKVCDDDESIANAARPTSGATRPNRSGLDCWLWPTVSPRTPAAPEQVLITTPTARLIPAIVLGGTGLVLEAHRGPGHPGRWADPPGYRLGAARKVQSIQQVEGPLQRRLRLAMVHLDTAGRSIRAALRDRDQAESDQLLWTLTALCRAARAESERRAPGSAGWRDSQIGLGACERGCEFES